MPIPHNGARGSPLTDARVYPPAMRTAAATVVSGVALTGWPFTVSETTSFPSGMRIALLRGALESGVRSLVESLRQISLRWNFCLRLRQMIRDQASRSQ